MLLLLPRADLSGEAVHGDHSVHVATEIVKILLVEGEDDVSEVVNVAPTRLSAHTPDHLEPIISQYYQWLTNQTFIIISQ